ncbi:DEAD-box type RNA helicase [Clydaea vesicula]|uniref:DEAD-box type RNA helicase n=1 Tax=Clydaea vesicula TaxID=447962 RepID=A0AAD5TYW5_9FUNG|nr:DEAD-box type RNA helicase [Clydaea vesicula]
MPYFREESVKMISALLAFSKIYPGEFWTSLVRLLEIFNKNCSFEETPFMLPFIKHMTSIIGEILCILYTVDEGESHKGLNLPKLWVETWTFINHVLQSSAIWAKKSKDARHLVKNFLPEIFAFTSFLLDVDLPKYTAGDDFSEDEFSNFLNFPFMLALSSNFPWFSTHDDRLRLESVDLCCRMLRFAAKVEDWEIPQEIIDQVGKFADKTIATPLQDRERERLLNWDNLDVSDFAEEELLIVDNMKVDNDIKRDNDVVGRELVDIMDVDSELKKAPEEKSDIVEEKNILNEKTTVNKEAVQPIVENKISKKDTMLAWQMMAKAKKQNQSSKKPGLKSSIMKQLRNDVIAESRRIQLKPAVNSYKGYDQSFEVTPLSELTEFEVSRPKRTMQKIDLPNATLHPSQVRIQNMQQPKIKALGDISSLHKQLLLWTFPPQGKNIFPPGFDKDSLKVIPKSFENTREYATVFEPLMVLECWEQFCHAKDEVRKSDAVLTSISEVNAVDGFYDIVFNADAALVRMRNISDHDLVQICEVKNSDINVAIGTLPILAKINSSFCKKDSCTITARIFPSTRRPDIIPRLRPGSSWSLLRLISLITAHREYTAMLNLPMVPLSSQIMNPGKVVLGSGYKINSKNVKELTKKFDINEPQASAVDACVGQKSGFVLIQAEIGPPGTGKTKTIMTIIGSLLTHSTSLNASTSGKGTIIQVPVRTRATKPSIGDNSVVGNKKRLLCCAPSNAACDELVRRLRDGVQDYSGKKRFVPNVVRMGTLKSVHEDVKDLCLELLVEAKFMEAKEFQHFLKSTTVASAKEKSNLQQMEKINRERDNLNDLLVSAQSGLEISEISNKLRDLNDKRKDLMREIFEEKSKKAENKNSLDSVKIKVKQRILSEADVIVSTLSSAGHDTLLNAKLEFPTVIIDEACQSIELSGIIPLKYGAKKCILVGDPNQLPPTVLSNLGKEYQYEQSLFQRIMLSIPNQVHLLSIQYRMHPMISSFPSKLFYESKLIDGGGLMEKRKAEWHDKEVLSPYRFFNVKGTEQKKSGGKSVYNLAEIDAIVSLINYLCISYPGVNFAHRIGVITPYKLQYFKIRDRLVELGGERILKVIDLNTVDGFQGQEKDIIILSCVRGGIDKGIGFLGDVRRMNVAFTRAKCSLFVVGNAEALKTNEQWRVFVEDAVARNVLSKWNETTLSNYNNFNFFPGNLFGTISLKRCIDKVANGT